MRPKWIETVIALIVLGLCAWTLKQINSLNLEVTRIETNELWIKAVLKRVYRIPDTDQ